MYFNNPTHLKNISEYKHNFLKKVDKAINGNKAAIFLSLYTFSLS